jgi:hypothetical protein
VTPCRLAAREGDGTLLPVAPWGITHTG